MGYICLYYKIWYIFDLQAQKSLLDFVKKEDNSKSNVSLDKSPKKRSIDEVDSDSSKSPQKRVSKYICLLEFI